jgi:bacteriorhodopsin
MSDDLVSKDRLIFSFTLTYVLLLTTGTVTLIEALRTKIPLVRHIFNLETVISIIAGYFYSKFIDRIKESFKEGKPIDWQEIIKTRYLDWAITTPLMLMVLINVIAHHNRRSPSIRVYFVIILLNYTMLYLGYRGEFIKQNILYFIGSFLAFFVMFGLIFFLYVKPKYNTFNYALFFFFLIVWSLYGIVYKMDLKTKNITYNYLDLISKCFVGIGLWVYFTNMFKV